MIHPELIINGRLYVDSKKLKEEITMLIEDDDSLCESCRGNCEDCHGDYLCEAFSALFDKAIERLVSE